MMPNGSKSMPTFCLEGKLGYHCCFSFYILYNSHSVPDEAET